MFRISITVAALSCLVALTPISAAPQQTARAPLQVSLAQSGLSEEFIEAREDALAAQKELQISLKNLIEFLPKIKADSITNAADFNKAKTQLPKQITELSALYANFERATKKPELTQQLKKIVTFLTSLEATGELLLAAINVETMDAAMATEFEEVTTDFSLKLISAQVRAERLEDMLDES
jgi:hypothetical protein